MRVWGHRNGPAQAGRVARAAATGAVSQELVKQAVETLLATGAADRAGAWVASGPAETNGSAGFQGMVADLSGEVTPSEWTRWSPEAPLPTELLKSGKSFEQDLDDAPGPPVVGALVGMRRALWVPVEDRGRLRGMLFAGTRSKHAALPRALLEGVAAELRLALELEEERRLGLARHADLDIAQRLLAALASSPATKTDSLLASLADSCIEAGSNGSGLAAVFAAIGQIQPSALCLGDAFAMPPVDACEPHVELGRPSSPAGLVEFLWRAGDAEWTGAIDGEPLAGIWRRALEAHGRIATPPGVSWSHGEVARVIAIPLESRNETLGVLVAGLRPGLASAASLERLELRAAMATFALLRRAEHAQAERQAAWQRTLLEAGVEATVLIDASGRIMGLSRGARELLGERLMQCMEGELRAPLAREFQELFRVREQQRMEAWLSRRLAPERQDASDAVENPLEAELRNGVSVRVRSLLPAGGAAVAVRLEPLRALVPAVRPDDGELQLLSLIEWLEEGVVLFDGYHRVRAMNSRFAQMTGLAAENLRGVATLDNLAERLASQAADPEDFVARWRELARGSHGVAREESHLQRPVPRVLERAARPVLDAAGRDLGRVEIYRDLTAQLVFQSKLLQTEKLAAPGQMVTGIAHELSNPLTSILGYAQRLLLRNGGAARSEEATQIFQEAERAGTIVRQLLTTARDSRPARSRVALNEVISRAMDLQRFSLAAQKIRVELNLDPALPHVLGDSGQLQQVLMNLAGNARQAIEQQGRGGVIQVTTRRIDKERVALEVRDHGPGIPEAIRARIFDPFFTTKPAGVGTGLGLPIVLGIVRKHGGQLNVSTPPGGGAMFTLEFPTAPVEESRRTGLPATGPGIEAERLPAPETLALGPESPTTSSRSAKGKVLIVEDEPTVARLIGDVLEDDGFSVHVLLDGRKALKHAASEDYDLVICDMKMPGLDGRHFYKTLARTGNPLRDKFLFVTGDVIAAQTHEFLERHHLPHVAKPFRVEELTEKVRDVLSATSAAQPQPEPLQESNAARKA